MPLDLRALPTWERHPRIRERFEALNDGRSLTIVTDHEPRPLRLQFAEWYPRRYVWSQRHLGIGRWGVTVRRVAPARVPESIADALRRAAAFADGREETLQGLAEHAVERSYANDATIVEQDAQWPHLGLVRTGSVSAVMGATSGREIRLFDVSADETFGIVELLDGGRTVARFVATSPARVVLLPRGIVLSAMATDAAVTRGLSIVCAQRVRALADGFASQVSLPAIARVAAAILPYAPPSAGLSPSLGPLARMTQTQLAVIAGTAKEVAARAIAELEGAGALKRLKGHIALVDREKLREAALPGH